MPFTVYNNFKIKKVILTFTSISGFFCSYMIYALYLRWDFNSEGKYFDANEGVTYHDSAFVWGFFAALFFIPLIIFIVLKFKKQKAVKHV